MVSFIPVLVIIILIGILLLLYLHVFYPVLQYGLPVPHPTTAINIPRTPVYMPTATCNVTPITNTSVEINCTGSDSTNSTTEWDISLIEYPTCEHCAPGYSQRLNYTVYGTVLKWNTTLENVGLGWGNESTLIINAYGSSWSAQAFYQTYGFA